MAEPIVIRTELAQPDVAAFARKLKAGLQSALDSGTDGLRATGKKIGDALSAGTAEAVKRNQATIDAIQARAAAKAAADAAKIQQEALRANGRLESIATQSAGRIAQIEAKKQADLDVLRERFAQREIERQRKLERAANNTGALTFFRRYSSTIREAGESIQQAGFALTGLTTGIIALGRTAVSSAVDLDRQVNVLKALTGSAEAAEARFAQLVATAQRSPGLTTSLAATLDAQLRVANVSVATIDKILPAIGRLNAVAPLGDPQKFAGNLVQLISQNFERQDLKELVGQSPLGGELIKQIFNVDNATNAAAIRESAKKLGIDTTEEFFAAFAQAASSNSKLAGVTESIGTQFEKLRDRVIVAFRPLGLALIEALQPLVERAVPIIEQLSNAFRALPDSAQQAILILTAVAAAIGPIVVAIGALIQTLGALGNIITVVSALFAEGGALAGAGAAIAGLAATIPPVAIALGAVALVIGGLVVANQLFAQSTTEAAAATEASLNASRQRVEVGQSELDALKNLREQSSLNADEQAKIRAAYDALTPVQRERVSLYAEEAGGIETTSGKLTGLIQLLEQENATRRAGLQKESIEQGKQLANQLNVTSANMEANRAQVERLQAQLDELTRKQAAAENSGERFGRSLAGPGVAAADIYRQKIAELSPELDKARVASSGNQKELLALATAFDAARRASGLTTEEFISQSIAASGLGGNLEVLRSRLLKLANLSQPEGPIVPQDVLDRANAERDRKIQDEQDRKNRVSAGGGESAESKARQLREAQLRFTKETLDQQLRLVEDANQRELKAVQERFSNEEISIREFYETKTGIEQSSIGNSINIIQQEIRATEESLRAAKANTPEKIRLEGELLRLRTELELKTRSLTDAETENQLRFLDAAQKKKIELLADLQKLALPSGESTGQLPTDLIAQNVDPRVAEAQAQIRRARELDRAARVEDLAVQQQELQIQQAISQGVISEAQGKEATLAIQRQLRDVLIASLEAQKALETDPEKLARLNLEIQKLATFGQQLTPAQAFFKGLRSEAETTAEAFERIGSNFKDKFLGVLDGGIDRLTQKFGFFKDLIGDILKSLTRKVISQLFGLGNPGGGGSAPAGGGGGFNLSGILGGILGGGNRQQGGGGGLNIANLFGSSQQGVPGASFLTGGFAGGNPAGAIFSGGSGGGGISSVIQSLFGGGGSSLSAPSSISLPGLSGNVFTGLGFPGTPGINPNAGGGVAGLAGLKNLFGGIGFGLKPGSGGGALAGILPLLGVGLGSSLGTDTLTKILGGAAGGLLGVGLTAAPALIGAGGALSGLGFLAPLFSNPITAIAAGLALPAIFLLGRARQRKRDEASSGDFLQDAIDSIRDLRKQVSSDQIDGAQARSVFNNEILQTFIQQINTLKTKSVRESRLKNQTADLKKLFEDEVGPEIEAQKLRSKTALRLVPEFALGGIVPGMPTGADTVLSWLSPREMVLTVQQQRSIAAMAGPEVFAAAGVPGAGLTTSDGGQAFQFGGVVQASGSGGGRPTVINVYVTNSMTRDDSIDLLAVAAETDDGQEILANAQRAGRRNRVAR